MYMVKTANPSTEIILSKIKEIELIYKLSSQIVKNEKKQLIAELVGLLNILV